MSGHKSRKRAVCTSCGHRKPCDLHHPAREVAAPAMVVPECPADHRVLDRRQERAGMYRVEQPRTEIERGRWILTGAFDVLGRVRGRDEELDRRLSGMGSLLATFGDMFLGLLDVQTDPLAAFGPDPIVRTPRTFRGSRPTRRPEWRASKEPPESSDLERARSLFDMFDQMWLALFDEAATIGRIEVERLMARLVELEQDCSLCPLVLVIDDIAELLERVVQSTSISELNEFAEGLGRLRLICEQMPTLVERIATAETLDQAKDALDLFFASYLAERLMGETPGDGAESASGRGPGLHAQEDPRG